jgi:hypothetical protein
MLSVALMFVLDTNTRTDRQRARRTSSRAVHQAAPRRCRTSTSADAARIDPVASAPATRPTSTPARPWPNATAVTMPASDTAAPTVLANEYRR